MQNNKIYEDIELFTIDDTATLLKLSSQTIRKMIRNKEIQSIKIGKNIRISKREIDKILNCVQE